MKSASTRNLASALPTLGKHRRPATNRLSGFIGLVSPHRPSSLIVELERKINEQRGELEERSLHVQSIICNIEKVTAALEKEKRKSADYKKRLATSQEELLILNSQKPP